MSWQPPKLEHVLNRVARGRMSVADALRALGEWPYADLGFAKVDHQRHARQGFPEVILGQGKTPRQVAAIARSMYRHSGLVLVTRIAPAAVRALRHARLPVRAFPAARCAVVSRRWPLPAAGLVVVATAGTADIPAAEEAALTAGLLGARVERLFDVGVAGLHRLAAHADLLRQARCIVAAAGMEGALASVIGGLAACPVIGLPTSVGYGASWQGLTPLMTMLNACAPNVLAVNIDDGFGAGYCAGLINRLGK